MLAEKSRVRDFLKRHNMLADDIDFMKCVGDFIDEMDAGLAGGGSLPMLPTYLSLDNLELKNESVIVIDAGGTNFRSALVSFDENGKYSVSDFTKHRMPGTSGEIEVGTFFSAMAELVRPIIDKSDKIGFCFSYALEMTKQKDGRVLSLSKELNIRGAQGKLVGEGLLSALGASDKKIVLLNDTVAVLLAGIATYHERKFGSYAGFILGTGTNTSYIENNSNIKKDSEIAQTPGSMIINMESGSFDKIQGGDIDQRLTDSTINPEEYRFEKMISGAYFGLNLLTALKVAVEEGLFTKSFSDKLSKLSIIEGIEIDKFLLRPYGDGSLSGMCESDSERLLLYCFADCVTERAAKLAAINLAAVVKKSGAGENPSLPVLIIAEGTTFYKARFIKSRVEYYLKRYLTDEMGLYAEILPVEDATLLGSAIAGLIG